MKWTAGAVIDALREAYDITVDHLGQEEWALLTEVMLRAPKPLPGWAKSVNHYTANTRSIDALLVRNWSSGVGHRRIAVEVKVTKADYRSETDIKRAPAEYSAHQTTYAAPVGLIDPATLPDGWGLIEVYESASAASEGTGWALGRRGVCKWRVRPAERTPGCDMDHLVAAVARRASRAEERIRSGADEAALVPQLQAEVKRLTEQAERAVEARDRYRGQATQAKRLLHAVEGAAVCADCEEPIAYHPARHVWRHKDKGHERACNDVRTEKARLRREAATGARYLSAYPDPVEPKALRDARDGMEDEAV
jgi:hypothetical protein